MPITTSVFLRKDNKILLGLKKRGFGVGKMMGVGGKVENGESLEECARREVFEEIGVKITKIERMATIIYDDLHYHDQAERVPMYVFVATEWEGEPSESDEIKPQWFALPDIPYSKMWSDAQVYLPRVIRGEKFEAYFRYNEHNECVEEHVYDIPSKVLAHLTEGGYEAGMELSKNRIAARAVVMDDAGRFCLVHTKADYYGLPGGGVEDGELLKEALEREISEEIGYKAVIIAPLGKIIEDSAIKGRHQVSFFYLCRTDERTSRNTTAEEAEIGLEPIWFNNLTEAKEAAKSENCELLEKMKLIISRNLAALSEAERVLRFRKLGQVSLRSHHE